MEIGNTTFHKLPINRRNLGLPVMNQPNQLQKKEGGHVGQKVFLLNCLALGAAVWATLAIASPDSPMTAQGEFVFGLDTVCSLSRDDACVRLGSPWHVSALKKALPGMELTYSEECEGVCFIARTDDGILEILQENGRVNFFRSLWGAQDFKGNSIGAPLTDAVGPVATCMSSMNFVCWAEDGGQLGYIAEGCPIELDWKDGKVSGVTIPECATIGGFELGKPNYE